MCDFTGTTWAMLIATIASTAATATTSVMAANSQKKAAKYNAEVNQNAANDATMRANIRAQEIRERAQKVAGTQAAGLAASGLDTTVGTPAAVLNETALYGELDALRTINNGQRQAWGLESQADIELWQGRNAKRAGYFQAAGSLLSGATNAYGIIKGLNNGNQNTAIRQSNG